jgi:Family of unknown function (DUF6529)
MTTPYAGGDPYGPDPHIDWQPPPPRAPATSAAAVLVPLLVGGAVAVLLGVYGRLHEPMGFAVNLAGFSTGLYAKAWLCTAAALLGVVQVVSASAMYGKLFITAPSALVPALHRWSGRLAVLLTVPVVVHCLFALGFQADSMRVLLHSLLGCLFYGAFVAKMLALSSRRAPGWAVPLLGGALFTALVALWLTSALWVFGSQGVHF